MAGMYGADVEQLRALARSFDDAATRLDSDRMAVGNAIRINAWVGPVAVRFRAEWDSAHSVKVARAAARLHAAASTLRRNADDQERTSAVNGAGARFSGASLPVAALGGVAGGVIGGALGAVKGIVGAIELPQAVAEIGHAAARDLLAGKGAASWKAFGDVAGATKFGRFLSTAGTALGLASVGFGTFETVTKALEGDTQGAVYSGVKTLIGVAAVIPSPIQPFAVALGIGISVGELLSQNPAVSAAVTNTVERVGEAIGRTAIDTAQTIGRISDGVDKAAGSFLEGVGNAAKKLFPW